MGPVALPEIIITMLWPLLAKSPLLMCFFFNMSLQTMRQFDRQMERLNQDAIEVVPADDVNEK